MVDDSEQNVPKFTDGEEGSMSFITLDKKVKAHVKKQFKHMAGDFWTGAPDKVTKGTVNRRKRYANAIYEHEGCTESQRMLEPAESEGNEAARRAALVCKLYSG